MRPAQDTIGPLPVPCPEPRCGVMLQWMVTDPDAGVRPHYTYCHPGVVAPQVLP